MRVHLGSPCFTYYEGSDGYSDFPPIRRNESSPDPPPNRKSSHHRSLAVEQSKRYASPSGTQSPQLRRSRESRLRKKGLGKNNIVNSVQVTVQQPKVTL